jgi:hypothetical protein
MSPKLTLKASKPRRPLKLSACSDGRPIAAATCNTERDTRATETLTMKQDIPECEEMQATLALLEILALGNQQVERGEIAPLSEVAARLRAKTTAPPDA